MVKTTLSASAGDAAGVGSVPGSGRPPGGGHGNPLQYSCLENPKDRAAWCTTVHGVAKSRKRLKQPRTHIQYFTREDGLDLEDLLQKYKISTNNFLLDYMSKE